MPITVTTTDGRTLTFPDGMSRDQMAAALRTLPPLPTPPPSPPSPPRDASPEAFPPIGDEVNRSQAQTESLAKTGANLGPSAMKLARGVGEFLKDPVGNAVRAIPQIPGIVSDFVSTYSSPERTREKFESDPAAVLVDVLSAGQMAGSVPGIMRMGVRPAARAATAPTLSETIGAHIGRNADAYATVGETALDLMPGGGLAGRILKAGGRKVFDQLREHNIAKANAATVREAAQGESTLDRMFRETIEKNKTSSPETTAFWDDYQAAATPLEAEVRARVAQTVDPQLYSPARYLDTDMVSINANKAKNMGAIELAGESYPQLRAMLEEAIKAGDFPRAT